MPRNYTGDELVERAQRETGLTKFDSETFDPLRHNHLLTRDGRMKERKHYGLRGARKGTQFSKR